MKTVNSLSGGKTSSYIEVHYPADISTFALVCVDCHNANKKIDPKIRQIVNDKLQKYSSQYGEFISTTEDPIILKTMLDLEQMTGREITWLRGISWEQMMNQQKAIPNQEWRFCTYWMKIKPIFEFLYMYHELPVKMRIGYRYDEKERVDTFTTLMKYAYQCSHKNTWRQNWKELTWREGHFPLVDEKIFHKHIVDFWSDKDIVFPADSNCQNCFWKDPQQLRKNFDANPNIMMWAAIQESIRENTFKKEMSLLEISKIGIQLDFFFGTGAGCQGGFCTN
jgi:hypothetical protein